MTETKAIENLREYSQEWYTLGRSFLPEFLTPQFARIAGNSASLAYSINPNNDGQITIKLSPNCETAYVDLSTKTIYISEKYFSSELYTGRFGEDTKAIEELAIALINGSTVHESLHIKFTENRGDGQIPDILKMSTRYYEMKRTYGSNLICTVFNIAEDLYIDSMVPKGLAQWLQNRAEILFPESELDSIGLPETNLADAVNLMIRYKNKATRSNDQFEGLPDGVLEIMEKLSSGRHLTQLTRVQLSFDLVVLLPFEYTGDDEEGESGEKESESGANAEKGEAEVSEELKQILSQIEKMESDEFERIANEIEGESKEVAKSEMKTESFGSLTWKKLIEEDVLRLSHSTYGGVDVTIEPTSEINFNFLKELQAIRTLNRTVGQARTRGSVLVKSRLTRIATDGKIFAKLDTERRTLKRIEVIINIDYSASTRGSVINNEVGAAKEMSRILKSARIAHSVYGHTSKNGDIPLLFHVFSYDMKTTNFDWDARFDAAEKVTLSENYDGVVIERLQEKFTGKNATRYIINLSDGQPCGPGYAGSLAANHTQVVIGQTRKLGIGVFAISVVGGVVYSNDRIYGHEFNIDGSANVNVQFRNLIRKLVGG